MKKSSIGLMLVLGACGGSGEAPATGVQIVSATNALSAGVGDALKLSVVETLMDGTTRALPSSATVTWSGAPTVTALDPDSMDASPIPPVGDAPTVFFVDNPGRPDRNVDLPGVLFVYDQGTTPGATVSVSAQVSGITAPATQASATVAISGPPTGDATRGQTLYGLQGAQCASCHGDTGDGSQLAPGSTDMYKVGSKVLMFPAPGLNAVPDNVVGDPDWNVALFAISARADMDNDGLTLRFPMPDWLSETSPATHQTLTTQDLYDIYAFMATQTQ